MEGLQPNMTDPQVQQQPSMFDPQVQQPKQRPKKKRYSRYTKHQIQEMESFFNQYHHPNEMQRRELARKLDLNPMQIKFWFQNKRNQIKTKDEREENKRLRAENGRIIAENQRYEEALYKASCAKCGGPISNNTGEMSYEEQYLRIENGQLKDEIARMLGRSTNNFGSSMTSFSNMPSQSRMFEIGSSSSNYGAQSKMETYFSGGSDIVRSLPPPIHNDKPIIAKLAMAAMEELKMLAASGPPLWIPGYSSEILNVDEYTKAFSMVMGPKILGHRTEASRGSVVVIMNHINLVEILMDVNQWSDMFSDIVTRGMTLEVLSTGVAGNYNGAMQVMSAEFQIPSPLAPTRDNYFVRYCKHHQDGTWAVVDVSLDYLRPSSALRSRRRPSGCVIQELPNGHSKVTWVEHVDVDDRVVMMDNHFIPLVNSCIAFGARRWLASLDRQCERLVSAAEINIPSGDLYVIMCPEGRRSILRLAERLMASYCASVGSSKAHDWTPVNPADHGGDLKVMTRNSSNDLGRPFSTVLSVATSFRLPVTPKRIFDFLRDNNTRSQWDILSTDGIVQEMAHIASGRDPGNCVSLLRVMNNANTTLSNMMILQESCTDSTGSYLVFAPIDVVQVNLVLSGGDPNYITLLPSGFAILPDGDEQCGLPISNVIGSGGCVLTVAFQILVDTTPTKPSPASVAMITSLVRQSIRRIKAALRCESAN